MLLPIGIIFLIAGVVLAIVFGIVMKACGLV
jgi:hypothetical protein